jgi:hypothetical protein
MEKRKRKERVPFFVAKKYVARLRLGDVSKRNKAQRQQEKDN